MYQTKATLTDKLEGACEISPILPNLALTIDMGGRYNKGGSKEDKMRNGIILAILLVALVLSAGGCGLFDQPGKTAAEVNRDHIRMLRINQQEMMSDIDRVFILDSPSKLTEMRIP